MSKEAMKLALEALKELVAQIEGRYFCMKHDHVALQNARFAIARLREALAKPDFWDGYVPEPDKRQQALNKKAENARELGLDYEPAQQEPEYAWPTVADYERDVGFQTNEAFRIAWNMARTTNRMLGHASSQPAQRTWVGLTIGEIQDLIQFKEHSPFALAEDIEAKLKEKNT